MERFLTAVDEILIIDTGSIPADLIDEKQVKAFAKKSLNDAVIMINNRPEKEKADWLLFVHANESFQDKIPAAFDTLSALPRRIEGLQFPVATIGMGGKIDFCQFETRLVRLTARPQVWLLNQLQVQGKVETKRMLVRRDLREVLNAPSSRVYTRIRDDAVRCWERCPDDLQAVFLFYQFLHWIGDADEIVDNCMRTLEQYREQISRDSQFWGLFAILGAACFQKKEMTALEQTISFAKEVLPKNHLDLLYLSCLEAKLMNDHNQIVATTDKFLARHKSVQKNPVTLAKNSIYALRFEKQISRWRLSALTALENWPVVFAGLRRLTSLLGFNEDDALVMLEEMQFVPSDKLATILPLLWRTFASPQFVLDSLKIFPFDILNEKTRRTIEKELLPRFRGKKEYAAGLLFMMLSRYQDALDVFLVFEDDAGAGEGAMFNAAQMYLELGYFEEAIKILAKLLRQYPANKDARLLYEGLNPEVGDVRPAEQNGENEIEETLLEAMDAIKHYAEKQKFDPIFSLAKQVHDVLAPYSEIKVEIFGDLPGALSRIESLAISHCYLKLADEVHKLRSVLKTVNAEKIIKPD